MPAIRLIVLFSSAALLLAAGGALLPAATPSPAVAVSGPPAGLDMVQTFADDFSGDALDTKKWNMVYGPRSGGEAPVGSRSLWSNGEAQIYFDRKYLKLGIDPFSTANGALTITAQPLSQAARNKIFGDLAKYPNLIQPGKLPRIEYSSGAITTRDTFKQRYGYFEMRASWSAGKGIWPAFWLLPFDGGWPPEIDVVEAHGDKPGVTFQSVHSAVAKSATLPGMTSGSQQDFHTYGVLWMPGRVDFYIDGVKTNSIPEAADMTKPMYMIANMAIGGYWPGYPDADPKFLATMKIDYIRVWQFRTTPPNGSTNAH